MNNTADSISVVTIASANYLPYVKTLMSSIRETNPSYRRYLVLVDKQFDERIDCGDLFEIIEAESLGIDSFGDMTIRYDVMELNTAVKPFAIEWLLDNTDASTVIYLDPDICVYRRLDELEAALADASVVVTPHLTQPLEDGKSPNDHSMLQAGVFNLGFIAVNNVREARDFVGWWGRRLKEACHADFNNNLFTDQRWVDLAPCFLADLKVLRDPAYNVAYWNLVQRPVTTKREKLYFGGKELAFFHFSGLQFDRPTVVSKHQDRLTWKNIRPLHPLFKHYRERLQSAGWGTDRSKPYHYDRAGDLQIVPIIRRLFRDLYPESLQNVAVDSAFIFAMCNQPARLQADSTGRVTRLMHKVYRERPDLQMAFALNSPERIDAFAGWFATSAEREYGVDPRLARPSSAEQKHMLQTQLPPFAPARLPNHRRPWLYRRWRKARKWLIERI
jgi:hypothetical protein